MYFAKKRNVCNQTSQQFHLEITSTGFGIVGAFCLLWLVGFFLASSFLGFGGGVFLGC